MDLPIHWRKKGKGRKRKGKEKGIKERKKEEREEKRKEEKRKKKKKREKKKEGKGGTVCSRHFWEYQQNEPFFIVKCHFLKPH